MKKLLITIVAAALLVSALNSVAQVQTVISALPVYQATDSNLATTVFLDVRRQQNVCLEWTIKHSGTATAAEGMVIRPSLDGVNVTTEAPWWNFIITPTSGTTKRAVTNINCIGYPYLAVTYITNIDADTYSTNTLKYFIKPNAP